MGEVPVERPAHVPIPGGRSTSRRTPGPNSSSAPPRTSPRPRAPCRARTARRSAKPAVPEDCRPAQHDVHDHRPGAGVDRRPPPVMSTRCPRRRPHPRRWPPRTSGVAEQQAGGGPQRAVGFPTPTRDRRGPRGALATASSGGTPGSAPVAADRRRSGCRPESPSRPGRWSRLGHDGRCRGLVRRRRLPLRPRFGAPGPVRGGRGRIAASTAGRRWPRFESGGSAASWSRAGACHHRCLRRTIPSMMRSRTRP